MTAKQLAEKLNGRQIGEEIQGHEEREAERDGLVVLFGASDDLAELRGAIHDEVSCYDGGEIYVDHAGLFETECEDESCPHEERLREQCQRIDVEWGKLDNFSWSYKTKLKHETFDIYDGEEPYCRGIVFKLPT